MSDVGLGLYEVHELAGNACMVGWAWSAGSLAP